MEEFIKLANLLITIVLCGAAMGAGFAGICKLLGWAPVNMTVNITNKYSDDEQTR